MKIEKIPIDKINPAEYNPRIDLKPGDKVQTSKINYVCEICGTKGYRHYAKDKIPKHLFCSRECQSIWQKTGQDLANRNKNPEFRLKVSTALKKRKERLGDNYHSAETKKKIGAATKRRWIDKKTRILPILLANAESLRQRDNYPYDTKWKKQRVLLIRNQPFCCLCNETNNLHIHHIVPYEISRNNDVSNLVILCSKHHQVVEHWSWVMFEILENWDDVAFLIKKKLFGMRNMVLWKLKQLKQAN